MDINKNGRTCRVRKEFILSLKKIQGKIKAQTGFEPSFADLTSEMVQTGTLSDFEKKLLNNTEKKIVRVRGIKFDGNLK